MAHTATEDCTGVAKVDSGAPQTCVIMGGRAVLVTGTGCYSSGHKRVRNLLPASVYRPHCSISQKL